LPQIQNDIFKKHTTLLHVSAPTGPSSGSASGFAFGPRKFARMLPVWCESPEEKNIFFSTGKRGAIQAATLLNFIKQVVGKIVGGTLGISTEDLWSSSGFPIKLQALRK
jgi:hypothetical protein